MALTSDKPRSYLADYPVLDMTLPLKAATTVYSGSLLMWSSGAVAPLSGAGIFAGIALEGAVGGAADGTVAVRVRVSGALLEKVTTDTPAITDVGVAATVPEATDDDTIRIERAATFTGTAIGKFLLVDQPGTAGGKVMIGFKGAQVP